MHAIDFLLIGVVALSVLIGLVRGFLREAVSLAVWVLAVWAALRYAGAIESWFMVLETRPELRLWVARATVFIAVLLVGTLINYALSLLVRSTGLSGTDRTLGMVFGFGRGVLIVGLLVMLGQYAGMHAEPWWQQSLLMPLGENIADSIRQLASEAMQEFGTPSGVEQE